MPTHSNIVVQDEADGPLRIVQVHLPAPGPHQILGATHVRTHDDRPAEAHRLIHRESPRLVAALAGQHEKIGQRVGAGHQRLILERREMDSRMRAGPCSQ